MSSPSGGGDGGLGAYVVAEVRQEVQGEGQVHANESVSYRLDKGLLKERNIMVSALAHFQEGEGW
jgi:hypothetical protein